MLIFNELTMRFVVFHSVSRTSPEAAQIVSPQLTEDREFPTFQHQTSINGRIQTTAQESLVAEQGLKNGGKESSIARSENQRRPISLGTYCKIVHAAAEHFAAKHQN